MEFHYFKFFFSHTGIPILHMWFSCFKCDGSSIGYSDFDVFLRK
jgi:hypothetical protein